MTKATLKVEPIGEGDWETALTVLGKAFKHNSREFWQRGLERHQMVTPEDLHWPMGHLLWDGDRAVGVLLAFRSRRVGQDGQEYTVANLAGWVLEEGYRWYAPFMIKKISRDQDMIYTDLTPLNSVGEILRRFRWTPINGGIAFFSFAQGLAFWARSGRIADFDMSADYGLEAHEHELLCDHARIGCVTAILQLGDDIHPLVFVRQSCRVVSSLSLPYLGLVYARDKSVVLKSMTTISRHLLKRGHLLTGIDCFREDVPLGGLFHDSRNTVKYHTGPPDQKGVDQAYSELVFLFV